MPGYAPTYTTNKRQPTVTEWSKWGRGDVERELNHEDLYRADMAQTPVPTGKRPGGMGDTHICLDKQLPCLYPFPQRSQRSSAGTRFPSLD